MATPSLSVPVDGYGATLRSATLAVGNLVDQMRSFDNQVTNAGVAQSSMGTSGPSALTSMQAAPIGMLDPLKKPTSNDLIGFTGVKLNRF